METVTEMNIDPGDDIEAGATSVVAETMAMVIEEEFPVVEAGVNVAEDCINIFSNVDGPDSVHDGALQFNQTAKVNVGQDTESPRDGTIGVQKDENRSSIKYPNTVSAQDGALVMQEDHITIAEALQNTDSVQNSSLEKQRNQTANIGMSCDTSALEDTMAEFQNNLNTNTTVNLNEGEEIGVKDRFSGMFPSLQETIAGLENGLRKRIRGTPSQNDAANLHNGKHSYANILQGESSSPLKESNPVKDWNQYIAVNEFKDGDTNIPTFRFSETGKQLLNVSF